MAEILVTGADGQLGSEIRELAAEREPFPETHWHFTDKAELDITDEDAVAAFCREREITHVINCAAYTAVDKAESDERAAEAINHRAVEILAQQAKERGMGLVHVSTDYVFDGRNHRPYVEEDPTDPQGVYGRTKLAGEEALRRIAPKRSVIVRTSWVYSSYGANFVKTMLRLGRERDELGVIFDQVGTPTYARDLAEAILEILPRLENEQPEIYHYSDEGVCSWYDFALAIFEETGVDCRVRPIRTEEYPTPAARPHYSLLDKSKIKEHYGLKIPHWRESLNACLKCMGEKQ